MLLGSHEERNVVYSTEQADKEREQQGLESEMSNEDFNMMCEQEEAALEAMENGTY